MSLLGEDELNGQTLSGDAPFEGGVTVEKINDICRDKKRREERRRLKSKRRGGIK